MTDLGVFDLLKVNVSVPPSEMKLSSITLVKLKSDIRSDGKNVQELLAVTKVMIDTFSSKPGLYTAISEAIQNSVEHAYPDDAKLEFPVPGKRWWATVAFDVQTEILRFFVYDQGVGIPNTLPSNSYYEDFRKFLNTYTLGAIKTDATILEAAMEYGRSSTLKTHRGKGLAKMAAIIEESGEGKIRILSARGQVTYEASKLAKRELSTHLGGTLVEWSIPLRVFNRDKGE